MSLELVQVVAELVQAVGLLREVEGVEDGLMHLPGRPAADLRTAMQEDLEQADDARLVDLEAGITHRADSDRMGEALQQREIDMHVEPLGLEAGEAISDHLEGGPHGIEMVEPLAQAEFGEIVGDQAARRGDRGVRRLAGALARVVVAKVDMSDGAEAPVALASAAYGALDGEPGGVDYSALLDESTHAGGDPLRAAKAASDRHDEIVRKLEAERTRRDEVEARAARLADTLLFETPGSSVDVFARARRGAIDARLRRFGLAGPDADASDRDLVRDLGSMGPGGRAGIALRSIWAYGGQRKLLFWAIVAFILGAAVSFLHGEAALSAIRGVAEQLAPFGDWIAAHADWFERAGKIRTCSAPWRLR